MTRMLLPLLRTLFSSPVTPISFCKGNASSLFLDVDLQSAAQSSRRSRKCHEAAHKITHASQHLQSWAASILDDVKGLGICYSEYCVAVARGGDIYVVKNRLFGASRDDEW
jgi:hypothetical protein